MSEQIVSFVNTDPIRTSFEVMDKFRLRKDRSMVWLQWVIFWILRKLRCYAMDESVTFQRYTLEIPKFMERLYLHNDHLMDFYHLRGERLLIGAGDFAELMNDTEIMHRPISFTGMYHAHADRICGMEVTVIPWMKGILVLPKEFKF